jgi:hypothetical protein
MPRVISPVKLLRPHLDSCLAVQSHPLQPWAYIGSTLRLPDRDGVPQIRAALYLNRFGEPMAGATLRWVTMGCNDLKCTAVVAVCEEDVLVMDEKALAQTLTSEAKP